MTKTYTYEEVRNASLEYFNGDQLAVDVFVNKYALKDKNKQYLELTPADMHRRLAKEFSRIESNYSNPMTEDEIFCLLDEFKYVVPQGSPMSAIGNAAQVQSLSNCFVIEPPSDSYGSIARADEEVLQIQKRRGGVGIDLSNIRPRGLSVNNAAGTSDGLSIFMERYSNTTREVAQGGRRGALMQTIDIRHPDIETFISIKQDLKKVTGANVSVRVNDEFMNAVETDFDFLLKWPVEARGDNVKLKKVVKARDIWNKLMNAVWGSGEPGILFWDTVLKLSMADEFVDQGFETICTNPCAELPLSRYDSCRLLLLNVRSYVLNAFTPSAVFDYSLFAEHVVKAQRLMDDMVDLELEAIDRIIKKVESDPEELSEKSRELTLWKKIKKSCYNGRRTGTGLTAVGDAVAALGITYGSEESIKTVEEIYKQFAINTHASSVQLAVERGAFPVWEPGRYNDNLFAQRLESVSTDKVNESFKTKGRRNIALTTTAPAGSVSTLTQTTSGIEPAYLLSYKRRKKLTDSEINQGSHVDFTDAMCDKWQEYTVYHHGFEQWMKISGLEKVEDSPYWKATSNDVDWVASVDLLAAAQRWTEHSISKTINLPNSVSKDLVSEVYTRAWKLGIKGVTVYRDRCRDGVLLSLTEQKPARSTTLAKIDAPKRPLALSCDINRVTIKGDAYIVLVGTLCGAPYEVFAGLSKYIEIPKKFKQGQLVKNGKKDGLATYNLIVSLTPDAQITEEDDFLIVKDIVNTFDNPEYGALTRMISLSLRHGVPINYLVEQLKKDKRSDLQSFSNVVARVLKDYIKDGTSVMTQKKCDECGASNVVYQQGCVSCLSCGWSRC